MDWLVIRAEYETTEITLRDLAAKHGISAGTIRSRKNRENWAKAEAANDATQNATQGKQRNATQKKSVATDKKSGRKKAATDQGKKRPEEAAGSETHYIVESSPLTEKQQLFALHFVKDHNATMAAIKAGCPKAGAHVQGSRMLRDVKVAAEIRRLKGDIAQDIFLTKRDVLEVYEKIAMSDPGDFFEFGTTQDWVYLDGQRVVGPDGQYQVQDVNFVRIKNSDQVDTSMVQEIRQTKDGISIKFHDKHKALDRLADFFDLTPDQHRRKVDDANLKLAERRTAVNEADLEIRRKAAEDSI
ncbi:putative PBSX phage terminase small subunit [Candidatus Desulfosporosinus infrequens]|uniref:Putative PBSX phage terminase small subunit n=1 Tax=Candidatus Desulfosporosinus infrequens TaxID=2043169 RepID=A0A2U3LH18_9FIRM|nr:putative PBSX phage terminase small subunit [Candidatus Desulfosporosinus infrequens]